MIVNLHVVAAFALLWAVVVPTPGANSLMVTHVALTQGRAHVALAIAGNMVGILLLGLGAVFGMAGLLQIFPWARLAIGVFGGLYLIWFGVVLVRRRAIVDAGSDGEPASRREQPTTIRTLAMGFATALSNAQAIVFISSIFAAAGLLDASLATGLACIAVMIVMNASWLSLLGALFTLPAPRRAYLRFRRAIETTVGVFFIAFGARVVAREIRAIMS